MARKNYFFSYHHNSDLKYLKELRNNLKISSYGDFGFKDEDLGNERNRKIAKKIQYRLWSSSITIVLIGSKTGNSSWIDWEIWYSLQRYYNKRHPRRSYKPKALLALYLPVENHNIPERLSENIESGYAKEIRWEELDDHFEDRVSEAINNRNALHLIRNQRPLKDDPRTLFRELSLEKLIQISFWSILFRRTSK